MCHRGLMLHLKQFSIFAKMSFPHTTSYDLHLYRLVVDFCVSFTLCGSRLSPATRDKKALPPITIDTMCDNAHVSKVIVIFMAAVDTK